MSAPQILRIDTSAQIDGSVSRELSDILASALAGESGRVTVRNLATDPIEAVDHDWVGANFTPAEERSEAQKAVLAQSDALVEELKAASDIVIGVPIYNFAIPAALKAWVDKVARARLTFRYSEAGPEGLLGGRTAWLVVASGGVPVGSDVDFATPYLRHVLGFMGIDDVRIVDAGRWPFLSEAERDAVRALAERPQEVARAA
ncbi:FMN-dependent NADH-azoreductase 3 [Marinicauda pacifica]|uniref:FMN dependent NADH:quinone oxidoreductase n=1 Tax=Marinicauda pacifica TaxID=1133559 RepID=A0A4S2HDY4_9PROT|nr:NAD(P)H-dependent oxidoreductase [Marinicauda pacifica]TGY94073.1 FMN-dependent NADH-azoreductase [Marinicauda pacifica]GGE32621.1 FMN-dependent NADH-azoreductase 3 [Marinicauda pacifica]